MTGIIIDVGNGHDRRWCVGMEVANNCLEWAILGKMIHRSKRHSVQRFKKGKLPETVDRDANRPSMVDCIHKQTIQDLSRLGLETVFASTVPRQNKTSNNTGSLERLAVSRNFFSEEHRWTVATAVYSSSSSNPI